MYFPQKDKPRPWGFLQSLSCQYSLPRGFPGGSVVKNLPANVGDTGSIPGSGRSPGGGHGSPLQCSCLGESHGKRSLVGHSHEANRVGHELATQQQQGSLFKVHSVLLLPEQKSHFLNLEELQPWASFYFSVFFSHDSFKMTYLYCLGGIFFFTLKADREVL